MQQPIQIVRGTTHTLYINLADKSGNAYVLAENETLRFALKHRPEDKQTEIVKDIGATEYDEEGHCYVLRLSPSETEALTLGRHFYDIGMQSGTDYIPVIGCSTADILPNISSRAVDDDV